MTVDGAEEAREILQDDDILVTNQSDKKIQLEKLPKLELRVKAVCLRLTRESTEASMGPTCSIAQDDKAAILEFEERWEDSDPDEENSFETREVEMASLRAA